MSAQLGRDYNGPGAAGATRPREISTGALLAELAGRLDSIHTHLGECIEKIGGTGSGGIEKDNAAAPSISGNIHGLIDHCELLVTSIQNRVEHIHARL